MDNNNQKNIGFVFLHGAGLGAWIWEGITARLTNQCLSVDLPGRGKHDDISISNLSLKEYVESVVTDIKQFTPLKLIIVSHSISGIIGLEVANILKDRVIGFIAISASIPFRNGSYLTSLPLITRIFLRIMIGLSGTKPPDSAIKNGLCNDLDDLLTLKVIKAFTPESKNLYYDRINVANVPNNSLFIRTKKDKAFDLSVQNQMIKNMEPKQVIDIDSGHLPMLNKIDELTQIINRYVSSI